MGQQLFIDEPRASMPSTAYLNNQPFSNASTDSVHFSFVYVPYRPATSDDPKTTQDKVSGPPILRTSVQDADYRLASIPGPKQTLATLSNTNLLADRKFSFDFGAPQDGEFVEAYSRSQWPTRLCKGRDHLPNPHEHIINDENLTITSPADKANTSYTLTARNASTVPPLATTRAAISTEQISLQQPLGSQTKTTSKPVPLPTTRYYASAIYQHGRFLSRRYTPHGTVKLPHHDAEDTHGDSDSFKP